MGTLHDFLSSKVGFIYLLLDGILAMEKTTRTLRVHLVSFFEKTTYCCRTFILDRHLFVRGVCILMALIITMSVRPSVEIISLCGISISNRPIDLKISLNVREGAVHVRTA